jgi:hypothetical protein
MDLFFCKMYLFCIFLLQNLEYRFQVGKRQKNKSWSRGEQHLTRLFNAQKGGWNACPFVIYWVESG